MTHSDIAFNALVLSTNAGTVYQLLIETAKHAYIEPI